MTLTEKLIAIYPELTDFDWFEEGVMQRLIYLRNDCDDRGDYIAAWNHSTLARPTDEELANV